MSEQVRETVMDAARLSKYIFVPDNSLDADVAIVLGMSDWRRPAARAVELFREGKARKLLFTGGYNSNIRATEAIEMAALARASGVPETMILVEPRAAHTDQNMAFSRELLEAHIGLAGFRSILLVTIHYHIRRTIIAARRHFPRSIEIGWVCYPSRHYSSSNWRHSHHGRANVALEVSKIEKYYDVSMHESEETTA
jgi:uncharacterized SAM-binding protein YcdF (DUF218 family)